MAKDLIHAGEPIERFIVNQHPCPSFIFIPLGVFAICLLILLERRVSARVGIDEERRWIPLLALAVVTVLFIGSATQAHRASIAVSEAGRRKDLAKSFNAAVAVAWGEGARPGGRTPAAVAKEVGFPAQHQLDEVLTVRQGSQRPPQFDAIPPD